jgi:ElaB/YqjD/DUF883 family membrane-anchored ribosome-binding protein
MSMESPPPPSGSDELAQAPLASPPGKKHRPWGWITACVLLVLVAGGLTIWALGLQGDLDDQKDQTAKAQQQADDAGQQAEAANQEVQAVSDQVDQLSQSVTDATDQLAQQGADAEQNAQQALNGIQDQLGSLKDQAGQAVEKLRAAAKGETQ